MATYYSSSTLAQSRSEIAQFIGTATHPCLVRYGGTQEKLHRSLTAWSCTRRRSASVLGKGSLPEGGGHGRGSSGRWAWPQLLDLRSVWTTVADIGFQFCVFLCEARS